jgi:hypothetical protein
VPILLKLDIFCKKHKNKIDGSEMRKEELLFLFLDISIMDLLMCEETSGLTGQTLTKAEHSGKPVKGKEVDYHHKT